MEVQQQSQMIDVNTKLLETLERYKDRYSCYGKSKRKKAITKLFDKLKADKNETDILPLLEAKLRV